MTASKKFWIETPLNALNKLMDQTFSYAQEAQSDGDLAVVYMDDLRDFKKVVTLFRNSDGEGIAQLVDDMDTEPRDQVILALSKDCGKSWVRSYLGYELS